MLLVDERNKWREEIAKGAFVEPFWLQDYRKNRESELWRSSRQSEYISEYILFLEQRIFELENKSSFS